MKEKVLGILLLCIMVLLGTVACSGSGKAPNGMTGAEILGMSQNASVNTSQFTAIVEMDMMGQTTDMYISGAFDKDDREMYTILTAPDIYNESVKIYMVDDWIYATNSSGDWIKTELTDKIWEEEFTAGQQMGLLEGFLDAKYLGMENISGFNCYKIDIDPNWDAIFAAADMSGTDNLSNEEIINMIKDTSCISWIAESSYYPTQIFLSITMEIEALGEKYPVTMDMTMTFSNINQPVTVTLPLDAKDATEVSYEDFKAEGY